MARGGHAVRPEDHALILSHRAGHSEFVCVPPDPLAEDDPDPEPDPDDANEDDPLDLLPED